ncbi:MAG: hypothetical protein IPJ19_13770 [Planctomycetes bacterium]|nr:hypothetical protein [Planctomycetota bacterium]
MTAPAYPLSREEFRRALATGLGRAKIHVARHGVGEFRDEVLTAATVCGVYDPQCHGMREDWLADLVLAAGVEHEVVALPVPEDPHDRDQRAALSKELARRGVAGAREALYACFGPGRDSNYYAVGAILALDGDAGLLFLAREFGKRCAQDADFSADEDDFLEYDQPRSEGAALALIATHAARDANLRAYLERVERSREQAHAPASRPARARPTIEFVIREIRTAAEPKGSIWAPAWGRKATREELGRLLDLLLELVEPRPLHHALWCLGMSTMAPLHPRIFELSRHSDDQVRYWAARCLSKHSEPGVRACGLEALARGDLLVGFEMLARSTLARDAEAIVAALRPLEDVDEQHGVCWGLLDILKESPEVVDPRLALYAYERNPCMGCRERALCWLRRFEALPRWIIEECAFDARADIRRRVATISPPANPAR